MGRAGRILAWSVGGLAALIIVVGGVGLMLPQSHSATVGRSIDASPEEVWAVISDVDAYPTWRPDVERVERLPNQEGLLSWREEGPSGPMSFEVVRRDPPSFLRTRIADPDLPFGGIWTYELERQGARTLVTITEDGEIYNPVYRFVSRFLLGYEATMVTYLDALAARVQQ